MASKEMKTLNDYEVVDQAVRDRVTTLEKNKITVQPYLYNSSNPVTATVVRDYFNRVKTNYLPGFTSTGESSVDVYSEAAYEDKNLSYIIIAYDTINTKNYYVG